MTLLVGGGADSTFGAFWGAYDVGLNRYDRRYLWDQRHWTHLSLADGEVLLVVATDDRTGADDQASQLRAELQRAGGRIVEPAHPRPR